MTSKTRIAVISDLHIGHKSIALDLCPHDLTPEEKVGKTVNFLDLFDAHVSSPVFKEKGPIDLLCITGDISDKADPKEFELAHEVISKVAASLGVLTQNIFYVPGNHDVHWPVMNLSPRNFWQHFRYEPLLQPGLLFASRLNSAHIGKYHLSPHFAAWICENDRIVVGINSAAFDSPIPQQGKHHGLIHQETIDELRRFLSDIPHSAAQLRICLLHHHPITYSDPLPNEADFSAAANAENLFSALSEHRFDLVIHGHKHVPHLAYRPQVSNGHPLMILGAGSFSARLDSQWVGTAQNQFHVIDVVGRDTTTHHGIFGHVSTWDFSSGRWIRSHSRTGVCATENFGALSTPQQIEEAITLSVQEQIKANRSCKWKSLEEENPELIHVNTRVAFETFRGVGQKLGLDTYGELDSPDRGWILIQL